MKMHKSKIQTSNKSIRFSIIVKYRKSHNLQKVFKIFLKLLSSEILYFTLWKRLFVFFKVTKLNSILEPSAFNSRKIYLKQKTKESFTGNVYSLNSRVDVISVREVKSGGTELRLLDPVHNFACIPIPEFTYGELWTRGRVVLVYVLPIVALDEIVSVGIHTVVGLQKLEPVDDVILHLSVSVVHIRGITRIFSSVPVTYNKWIKCVDVTLFFEMLFPSHTRKFSELTQHLIKLFSPITKE